MARGAPPPAPRLAPRRVARPGVPRRDGDPDLGAARPPADGVPRRLQRLPPPARGARRAARRRTPRPRPSRSRASGSSSSATGRTASSRRCTSTRRGSSASRRSGSRRRSAARKLRLPGGRAGRRRPGALRRDRRPGRGPRRRLPARAAARSTPTARRRRSRGRSRGSRSSPRSAASGSGSSGRTGPARRRSCGRSPATCRRSTAGSRSATPSSSATSPSSAARRSRARPCSTRCSTAIPVTPGEARGYLARFLFRGDDVFKEVRLAVGRRAVAARAGAARDHAVEPAPPRRADEPPRHPGPRGDRVVHARVAGDAARRVSHDRRLLETICTKLWVVDDGAGRAVRRRLPRVAGGGRRRLDGARGAAERRPRRGVAGAARPRRRPPAPAARADGAVRRGTRRRGAGAPRPAPRAAPGAPREALEGRLPPPEGRARRRADAGSGCARATSSWRWATRRSPRTSSRCAGSRASWPTSSAALAAAEDAWLELEERAP